MDEMGMVFVNGKGKERKKEWMNGWMGLVVMLSLNWAEKEKKRGGKGGGVCKRRHYYIPSHPIPGRKEGKVLRRRLCSEVRFLVLSPPPHSSTPPPS